MKSFDFYCPVRIVFGKGKSAEIGQVTKHYGKKVLLVTEPWKGDARQEVFEKIRNLLEKEGLVVTIFDGVIPNPTVNEIEKAAGISRNAGCEVIVGIGGGSSMDVAKATAIAQTHPAPIWNYVYFQKTQPTEKTLPIILITTTSGTGSHVSKCSVITNPDNHLKVGIVNDNIFAKVAIVDPELMLTVPKQLTASTGFDVFTHAFESYINVNANPVVDAVALESIRLLARYLPRALDNGRDYEARAMMAIADTFAGMSIANVGTTLPHSMGQPISGHFPHVPHGTALALVYPPIMAFSSSSNIKKFAEAGRIFNPDLGSRSDEDAARESGPALVSFMKRIGMYLRLSDVGISREAIPLLVKDAVSFPDTTVHPKVASEKEIGDLYRELL